MARLMDADGLATYRRACAHAATIRIALRWEAKLLASSATKDGDGRRSLRGSALQGESPGTREDEETGASAKTRLINKD